MLHLRPYERARLVRIILSMVSFRSGPSEYIRSTFMGI